MGGSQRLVVGLGALIFVVIVGWMSWVVVGGQQIAAGLKWSRSEMEAGRYDRAEARLARLVRWWGRNSDVSYLLGQCEAKLGHYDEALAAFDRVVPGSPQAESAMLARGRAILRLRGRLSEAESAYRSVARGMGPIPMEARWALAEILLTEGRHGELRRLLEEIGRVGSGRDRAVAMRELWRLDTVIVTTEDLKPVLETAEREAADDPGVWLARGYLECQYGRYPEAREWLRRCEGRLGEEPVVSRAVLSWAMAAGDLAESERAMARLKASSFTASERWRLAAWLAARRNNRGAERRALERLIEEDASDTPALNRLAALLVEIDQSDEAARVRKQLDGRLGERQEYRALMLAGREPIPTGELRSRAELAERLGRWVEARGWNLLILERASGDPKALAGLERVAKNLAEHERTPPALASISVLEWARGEGGVKEEVDLSLKLGAHGALVDLAKVSFREEAKATGLIFTYQNGATPERQIPETIGGGVAVLDFDGDGWLDVYLVQGGRFPPEANPKMGGDRLFRNRGDGTFEDVSGPTGIAAMKQGYGFGATVGDYDGDGYADLFVTRFGSYQLLRNRGHGTFEDVTEATGLGGPRDWPTSAAFGDFDGDGDLDLYVCHYLKWDPAHPTICHDTRAVEKVASCIPLGFGAEPDHLFCNDRGRFVDVTAEAGIVDKNGRGLGVLASDLDDDGRIDLFVANDMSANLYFHNLGGMKFEERGHEAGLACNAEGSYQAGMGVACGDLDGDGRPDVAVTNFLGESTTLFHNMGQGIFTDATAAIGLKAPSRFLLGFGAIFLDVNNDGYLDLTTANGHVHDLRPSVAYAMPAQLLLGSQAGILRDVTRESGDLGQGSWVGRGLAEGDFDNDGRVDLVLVGQNSPVAYFHNQTSDAGHFLTVRLDGKGANRDGNGARVRLSSGGRTQTAWRFGGGSYASASDPRMHFGLGNQRVVDQLEVRWMSGLVTRVRNLAVDRGYVIKEGEEAARSLEGFRVR